MGENGSEKMNNSSLNHCGGKKGQDNGDHTSLPPIIAVSGVKNSGKTTFLCGLLPFLAKMQLKVGVVKHDGHDFEPDVKGTDSWRLRKAGALGTGIYSASRSMVILEGMEGKDSQEGCPREELPPLWILQKFHSMDLILAEGFKYSSLPKIEIVRKENSKEIVCDPQTLLAVATDWEKDFGSVRIGLEDYEKAAEIIYDYLDRRKRKMGKERLNHFDSRGNAIMVDVSEKKITERIAIASGKIWVSHEVMEAVLTGTAKKGDVLGVARVAGIMGAKNTWSMIPMCHPLSLEQCKLDFETDEENCMIKATCTVKVTGKTGVEMEALNGVSTALLTIYDMCKALDRGMEIGEIHLEEKDGGKSGRYIRQK